MATIMLRLQYIRNKSAQFYFITLTIVRGVNNTSYMLVPLIHTHTHGRTGETQYALN